MTAPASIFDSMAANYDAEFSLSSIGKLQRERVWKYLMPLLQGNGRPLKILEINCGTGEDALKLASLGHIVVATDASAEMISIAKTKQVAGLNLMFNNCAFAQLPGTFKGEKFDLIFSNFGGLNCIDETAFRKLAKDLLELTKPGGNLFFVLMSSFCLWEVGYYSLKGKFKTAFRRRNSPANFTMNDQSIPVYYYSPGRLKTILKNGFSFCQNYPVGLFIPPSYMEERFATGKNRLQRLNSFENKFGYPLFSSFSDHYCAIFKNDK